MIKKMVPEKHEFALANPTFLAVKMKESQIKSSGPSLKCSHACFPKNDLLFSLTIIQMEVFKPKQQQVEGHGVQPRYKEPHPPP
jgi:hypothetical protein